MHVAVYLGNALHVGSKSCLYEFTELKFLSVGSQLPSRTLNILIEQCVHMSPCRPDEDKDVDSFGLCIKHLFESTVQQTIYMAYRV